MFRPFFAQAALSPGRQRAFRTLAIAHLFVVSAGVWYVGAQDPNALPFLGHALLIMGIVEGASLLGWRLTQLPKSLALEFLFVSPVRPWQVFLGEAGVGIGWLALTTLSGLPPFLLLLVEGKLLPPDLILLLVMPFTWGVLAGLCLITWAYEPITIRRWGERVMIVLIALYLLVGVLAGEHLKDWLNWLTPSASDWVMAGVEAMHGNSPFAVLHASLQAESGIISSRLVIVQLLAIAVIVALFVRASTRLKGHFHERHYQPAVIRGKEDREQIADNPLAWWAVKRVSQYAGLVNLWLAAGFALLYGFYTMAGPVWPSWLGRKVFEMFDAMGGIPVMTTALVILAAVPAAFQYGLWDSNAQDRCRRLELLLLTRLESKDYWLASLAAAWWRGQGYFALAVLLWTVYAFFGPPLVSVFDVLASVAAGIVLWGLYFTVGFQAFTRGTQSNNLGMLLCFGLPVLAIVCPLVNCRELLVLTPPGAVFDPCSGRMAVLWVPSVLLSGLATLVLAKTAQERCESELRAWFTQHHGANVVE